mmetsp:Transcript_139219/g.388496  ORF Transcript_139219/g.388496 Transcript_139219/m.388496 type:complete len:339 (-) Transcript_139219:118-1134(-)
MNVGNALERGAMLVDRVGSPTKGYCSLRQNQCLRLLHLLELDPGAEGECLDLPRLVPNRPEDLLRLGTGPCGLFRSLALEEQLGNPVQHAGLLLRVAPLPQLRRLLLCRENRIVLRTHLHIRADGDVQGLAGRLPKLLVLGHGVLRHLQGHVKFTESQVHLRENAQAGGLLRRLAQLAEGRRSVLGGRQTFLEVLLCEVALGHHFQSSRLACFVPQLLECLASFRCLPGGIIRIRRGRVDLCSHVQSCCLARWLPDLFEELQGPVCSLKRLQVEGPSGASFGEQAERRRLQVVRLLLAEDRQRLPHRPQSLLSVLPLEVSLGGPKQCNALLLARLVCW